METLQNLPWTQIAAFGAAFIVIAERIAALTETKKDDAFFGFVHKILVSVGLKFPESK
jgi:hypothetical protein